MDKLFEDDVEFKSITSAVDGSIDFNLFMISSSQDLWESLGSALCQNGNSKTSSFLQSTIDCSFHQRKLKEK